MPSKLNVGVAVAMATLLVASVAEAQFGGFRRGQTPSIYSLAAIRSVQRDLGVTGDQAEKLSEISRAFRQASQDLADVQLGQATLRALSPEARREYLANRATKERGLRVDFSSKLGEAIGDERVARLREIRVRIVGVDNREVVEELGLSEDQRVQLRVIAQDTTDALRRLRDQRENGQSFREKSRQLQRDQEKAKLEVLTDEQKAKFATMTGKPFDVSRLGRRRR